MRYTPKRSNHIADAVFTVCFASAVILYAASAAVALYKSVIQFSALIFFTAGLYILIRYKLVDYTYIIRARNIDETGYSGIADFDFVAEKVQGNRTNAECRLSMDDLIEIKKLPQKGGKKREAVKKYKHHLKLYHYTVTMYPPNPYLMVFYDNSEPSGESRVGVIFEPDEKMADYITDICRILNKDENEDEN